MRVITRTNGAARPASKPAHLRSTRGADRKAIVLKCNKKVTQVRDYQQEPPSPKPGAAAAEDDDGYWQLMLHAKCDARFYTAPHPHMCHQQRFGWARDGEESPMVT